METQFSGSNQAPTQKEIEIVLKPLFGAEIDKVLSIYSSRTLT